MTLSGPQTRFGFAVAAVACLIDQASKLYFCSFTILPPIPSG